MSTDQIFQVANTIVLPAWALLIFAPRWVWTGRIVVSGIVLFLALLYTVSIVPSLGSMDLESFGSLSGIMALFTEPQAVLVGWIHYLAFDLLVGWVIVNDAHRQGINHWIIVPAVILSFMFGPVGWLLYWVIRAVKMKSIYMDSLMGE